MKPKPKEKIVKKPKGKQLSFFHPLVILAVAIGIFLLAFLVYFENHEKTEKELTREIAENFTSTIETLNRVSEIKGDIDTANATNPKILEDTQQQIEVMQETLRNSRSQIMLYPIR